MAKSGENQEGHILSIFVTGSTGCIGSVIVRELIEARYQVLGLVCSDAAEVHAVRSMILTACEMEHNRIANIQDE